MRGRMIGLWLMVSLLMGCTTSMRQVTFTTSPAEALVYINGTFVGRTPVAVPLRCDTPQTVRFELDGVSFEQQVPTKLGLNESNPVLTWYEKHCADTVYVPLGKK